MKHAVAHSAALRGITGQAIQVHVDLSPTGTTSSSSGGASGGGGGGAGGDRVSRETMDRVRAAVRNTDDYPWPPAPATITTQPAVVTVDAAADLAVAAAIMAADGLVNADRLADTAFLGELGLDGTLRPVRGALPRLLALRDAGMRRVVVPESALAEAGLVTGLEVLAAGHFREVLGWLAGRDDTLIPAVPTPVLTPAPPGGVAGDDPGAGDLSDVLGQAQAVRALEIAAAGGHHLLLFGAPGSGRSMLARRLPGLLPALTDDEIVQATAIHSAAGALPANRPVTTPPFIAPHHTTSTAALLGGGFRARQPGQVSRAHTGVLHLDDAAEWGHDRLESLASVLDDHQVNLTGSDGPVQFPAQFLLVLTVLPCACGLSPDPSCICTPQAKRRHRARISRVLLARVPLRVRLHTPKASTGPAESTATVRARVHAARERAAQRWATHGWRTNSEASHQALRAELDTIPAQILQEANKGALGYQGVVDTYRVAFTIADLAGAERPEPEHVDEALALRAAPPTPA